MKWVIGDAIESNLFLLGLKRSVTMEDKCRYVAVAGNIRMLFTEFGDGGHNKVLSSSLD